MPTRESLSAENAGDGVCLGDNPFPLVFAPRSKGRCAGSARRITRVPCPFSAPSRSAVLGCDCCPRDDEATGASELENGESTAGFATIFIADFDHESFRECVRECDFVDLLSVFTSELEWECVPREVVALVPSEKYARRGGGIPGE